MAHVAAHVTADVSTARVNAAATAAALLSVLTLVPASQAAEGADCTLLRAVGGGTIRGHHYSARHCFQLALEAAAAHPVAWYNLAVHGGGTVFGTHFTPKRCYRMALSCTAESASTRPILAKVWNNLASFSSRSNTNGGTVPGFSLRVPLRAPAQHPRQVRAVLV